MCVEGYVKHIKATSGNMLVKLINAGVGTRVLKEKWILVEKDEDPNFWKYYNRFLDMWIVAGVEGNKLHIYGIWNPETRIIYSNIWCARMGY